MHSKPAGALAAPLLSLLTGTILAPEAAGGPTWFTNAELGQLQALCADPASAPPVTAGKKQLLLYHRDGYVPAVHFDLPDKVRADSLDQAAAVLCLADAVEVVETCNFNIFFSIPRERQQFQVEAVPLSEEGSRLAGGFMNGADPKTCSEVGTVDSTITRITGPDVAAADVLAFLAAGNLDRQDNDRDGLRNLEEFRLGTDPDNAASPPATAAIRVNGQNPAQLYTGETAEIRIDLYPGEHLGNAADYYFWADMPDGRYVLQFPAGFAPATNIVPALEAPLVRLLNYRLLRLKNLPAGDYRFTFEARDAAGSIEASTVSVNIAGDPCREIRTLPLAVNAVWSNGCDSVEGADAGYLARYYTFTLANQSALQLVLAADTARLILRDGEGRNGTILGRSDSVAGGARLGTSLDAGTYTVEVMLARTTATGNFELTSSNETIPWQFSEVSALAGIDHVHGYLESDIDKSDPAYERILQGAGVAAGDYDQDGWPDLYVTAGSAHANRLYRNRGDGTFEDMAATAGVAFLGRKDAGAVFADIDGDGWPDLFLGGVNGTQAMVLRNRQDGSFEDITEEAGLAGIDNAFSAAFADYDRDGDLDLYITHWNSSFSGQYLYRNDGTGVFTDISSEAGIPNNLMADYTPNFTDIDNDGWLDLLVAADFNTSQVYRNNRDGTFSNITDNAVITDDNGMGGTVGDVDNDGDIDWFVSSIFDPNGIPGDVIPGASQGATGNRLYRNNGQGVFQDVTTDAGVRIGGWGWGSCFADFDNDGWLDLFHVNGYVTQNFNNNASFLADPSRLFLNNRDGTFSGADSLLVDTGQGRGIACLDYDLDGDIDIFVANNQQAPALYRNDGGNDNNFLHIRVSGDGLNSEAIGARIHVTTGQLTQMRDIHAGNNFISGNPAEAYFGVGDETVIDTVRITWPTGEERILNNVPANQMLTIFK